MPAKFKKIPLSEQQLKTLIIEYLLRKGHFAWVNNSGVHKEEYTNKQGITKSRQWRTGGVKGASDIFGIEKGTGRFIAIECKVGRNVTSEDQDWFLDEIQRRGGHNIVAYTLEDVSKYL